MKWMKKHQVITAVILVVLLLVGSAAGYIWSKLRLIQYDTGTMASGETQPVFMPEEVLPPEEDGADISGLEAVLELPALPESKIQKKDHVVNILLLGTDERSTQLNEAARSDSMILVSINKTANTVKLVSLERGMGVPILEGENQGEYDLLTHIFRYGGAELVCRTVEECLRVEVDHYVRVNFTTVVTVVDAIGGIDIYLDGVEAHAVNQDNLSQNRPHMAVLREGINHLDGKSALWLAMLRRTDSDWQRIERQRRVILAAVEKLRSASLAELDNLLNQTLPLVQTNLGMLEIAELMLYSPKFLTSSFDQMTIPREGTYGGMTGLNGTPLFAVDFETNAQILKEFLYGGS